MKDKFEHARGWFRKAESDLSTGKRALEGNGPYDTACFHAQQTVEKYLKGFLAFLEKEIPPTHNLEELQRLCMIAMPGWGLGELDVVELTPYAVQLRYDLEFWPDRETAEKALNLAEQVRTVVLATVPRQTHP